MDNGRTSTSAVNVEIFIHFNGICNENMTNGQLKTAIAKKGSRRSITSRINSFLNEFMYKNMQELKILPLFLLD